MGEKEAEGREERRGGVCLLLSRALTRACALRRLLGPEGALPKVEKRLRSVAGKADQSSLVFLHAAIEELVTIRHVSQLGMFCISKAWCFTSNTLG